MGAVAVLLPAGVVLTLLCVLFDTRGFGRPGRHPAFSRAISTLGVASGLFALASILFVAMLPLLVGVGLAVTALFALLGFLWWRERRR